MGYSTSQFTNIAVAALDKHGTTMIDNIFDTIPTVKHLMKKGSILNWNGTGDNYKHPLMYAVSAASGATSGWKKVSTASNDFIGEVTYQMKKHYATISLADDDLFRCRGDQELVNLTKAKLLQAKNSIRKNLNTSLHAASVATDDIDSLAVTIDDSGTIGGINPSTYAWWASTETACGSFATGGIEAMQTMVNTLRNHLDGTGPDLIVTTQTVYQYYQDVTRNYSIRDIQASKVGDLGVPELEFEGIPIIYDPNCASGTMYFVNSKAINLVVDRTNNMKLTEFVKPADQMGKIAQMYVRLQLVCTERRALGKLTGITE